MSNFTGTEWICEENGNGDFFIDSSRGESIGILYNDVPEVEANARLVSAAPDMYDELYEVLQFMKGKTLWERDEYALYEKDIEKLLTWIDGNDSETPNSSKEGEEE